MVATTDKTRTACARFHHERHTTSEICVVRTDGLQDEGELLSTTRASTLDRAGGNSESRRGVGDRVPLHVDGDDRSALLRRQGEQCLLDDDGQIDVGVSVGGIPWFTSLFTERNGGTHLVPPDPVEAGIDDDAVEPAADGRVGTERAGGPMCRQHGFLKRVRGVLGRVTGSPGGEPQMVLVAPEEHGESRYVPRYVRREQFAVRGVTARDSPD